MQTALKFATMLTLVACLSACAEQLDGAQFNARLHASQANSAESWTVTGEDSDFYYLRDRLVWKIHYYKVTKKDVSIDLGPNPQFPTTLRSDEVKILR